MKKRILYYLFILLLFPHNGTGQTVARMSDRPGKHQPMDNHPLCPRCGPSFLFRIWR